MKIERYGTIDEHQFRQWMKDELFNRDNDWELIGIVKDNGLYEAFYKVYGPHDYLL